jgi:hypothetical protein
MRRERLFGKILQVICYDNIGSGLDCGGNDVPIVWIGKFDGVDKRLIGVYQAMAHRRIHQGLRSRQFRFVKLGRAVEEISHPFVLNLLGPSCAKQIGRRELHQQVANHHRI